jgi:hypothetical protein
MLDRHRRSIFPWESAMNRPSFAQIPCANHLGNRCCQFDRIESHWEYRLAFCGS